MQRGKASNVEHKIYAMITVEEFQTRFKRGDILYTEWISNGQKRRCILQFDKIESYSNYDDTVGDVSCLNYYGFNCKNKRCDSDSAFYGIFENQVRLATKDDIKALLRRLKKENKFSIRKVN